MTDKQTETIRQKLLELEIFELEQAVKVTSLHIQMTGCTIEEGVAHVAKGFTYEHTKELNPNNFTRDPSELLIQDYLLANQLSIEVINESNAIETVKALMLKENFYLQVAADIVMSRMRR